MSMTRAEAIEVLENGFWWELLIPVTTIEGRDAEDKLHEALDLALAALRFPTREMVERMRGGWLNFYNDFSTAECSKCEELFDVSDADENIKVLFDAFKKFYRFCPACGAPMTDEAVDMMLERWKEAVSND